MIDGIYYGLISEVLNVQALAVGHDRKTEDKQ